VRAVQARAVHLPAAVPVRVGGAALLLATAAIHLLLWSDGYRDILWIGPLFLLNAIGAAVLALAVLAAPAGALAAALPPGFVYLHDVDPSIAQDIRYAGADNFVGRPLPGYGAGECVLRRDAALALKQVQADLAAAGLGLKVYDCYRPARAVRAMAQWASDGRGAGATKRFFPRLDKSKLFALGYIAMRSGHSSGTAVDLTLVPLPRTPAAAFDPTATYGSCAGPAAQREPDDSLDMGTGYDCLDTASHTANPVIGEEQRRNRGTLVAAMRKRGFKNYFREWWHFSFGAPAGSYDVPIGSRDEKPAK
jgi:D-alanyl-D-alanine dipeptidase